MKNISLLPAELKSYKKSAVKISRISTFALISILVFLFAYALLSFALLMQRRELELVRRERMDAKSKYAELRQYEEMDKKLSMIEGKLKRAMGKRPEWDRMIAGIFNSFPPNAWLSEFSVNCTGAGGGGSGGEAGAEAVAESGGNAGEILIKGRADSHTDVADLLEALKDGKGLNNVKCVTSVASGDGGGSGVQFEIRARLAEGEEYHDGGRGSED